MATRRITPYLPAVWTEPLPDRTALAELYHENSKYHRSLMFRLGPQDVPAVSPAMPAGPGLPLPPAGPLALSLGEALSLRKSSRRFSDCDLALALLATILGQSCAIGQYPSAGARYAIQAYLYARRVAGLPAGTYRYEPHQHALIPVPGDAERLRHALLTPGRPEELEAASALLFLVADFPQMAAKYGARGYRFCLQESGHIAQNLQLVTAALGLGSLVMGAFLDDEVHAGLQLDGVEQAVLTVMPIGWTIPEEECE